MYVLNKEHKGQAKLLAKARVGEEFAKSQGWAWRIFSYN